MRLAAPSILVTTQADEIIARKDVELVVEAASQDTVKALAFRILEAGKNMLIMSTGALTDDRFYADLERKAQEKHVRIYLPSGAICGLDGVRSASIQEIRSVILTTTKHPISLEGAPYIKEKQIDLRSLAEPTTVFIGTAREAIKGFPMNVNVAACLSLAGIGADKTMVRIVADPSASKTQHEINVVGDFGELYTRVRNVVHPENPRTSFLAALSAVRTLKGIAEPIQIRA